MDVMELYLWRHGEAEGHNPLGSDADRRLVPQGLADVRNVAQAVVSRGAAPEKIYTSPYRRARETAAALQEVLRCALGIQEKPELASGAAFNLVYKALKSDQPLSQSIVLVGHMPDLSHIAENFLADNDEKITLRPGAVLQIILERFESRSGKIGWQISPADLIF